MKAVWVNAHMEQRSGATEHCYELKERNEGRELGYARAHG